MSEIRELPVFKLEETIITICVSLYGTILVFGAMMCSLLLLAMFRGRKILFQLILFFPSMVVEDRGIGPAVDARNANDNANAWYNSKVIKAALSILEFLPVKGLLYLSLLMSLNRLAVFTCPSLKFVFDKGSIGWTLLICWAVIDVLCIMSVFVRPIQRFNRSSLYFEDSGETLIDVPPLKTAIEVLDYFIPFLIISLYVLIYFSIRKKRLMISADVTSSGSRNQSADDTRMLWQSIVIALFLQLYNLTSIAGDIVDDKGMMVYMLNILGMIFSATNHSIHSTIFILTNSTIRNFLPRLPLLHKLGCKRKTEGVTAEEKGTHDNTG